MNIIRIEKYIKWNNKHSVSLTTIWYCSFRWDREYRSVCYALKCLYNIYIEIFAVLANYNFFLSLVLLSFFSFKFNSPDLCCSLLSATLNIRRFARQLTVDYTLTDKWFVVKNKQGTHSFLGSSNEKKTRHHHRWIEFMYSRARHCTTLPWCCMWNRKLSHRSPWLIFARFFVTVVGYLWLNWYAHFKKTFNIPKKTIYYFPVKESVCWRNLFWIARKYVIVFEAMIHNNKRKKSVDHL